MRTNYSSRGPGFASQHPHKVAYNQLELQFQGIQHPPLVSEGTRYAPAAHKLMQTHTHTHKNKQIFTVCLLTQKHPSINIMETSASENLFHVDEQDEFIQAT